MPQVHRPGAVDVRLVRSQARPQEEFVNVKYMGGTAVIQEGVPAPSGIQPLLVTTHFNSGCGHQALDQHSG